MDLIGAEWLAAAIAPWAVAPHPNFSVDSPSASSILALVADYRLSEVQRYETLPAGQPSWSWELIRSAIDSVTFERQHEGGRQLRRFALRTHIPLGARGAAALFAAVCFAEMDDPLSAVQTLDDLLSVSEISGAKRENANGTLAMLKSAALLQRALRRLERGDRDVASNDCNSLLSLIVDISDFRFESFAVSEAISWGSDQVQIDIIEALRRRAQTILSALAPISDNSWVQLVRSRPLWLDIRGERRAMSGLEQSVGEQYDSVFRSAGRVVRIGGGDPVAGPFEASLFNAEISADFGDLRARRGALGKIRLLRARSGNNDISLTADGVRLLRHSHDHQSLNAALDSLRAAGPCDALLIAARRVLQLWSRQSVVNRYDLSVVTAAAELLSVEERRAGLRCALAYRQQVVDPGLALADVPSWTRTELSWKAVAVLVPDSGMDDQVAQEGLDLLGLAETPYLLSPSISALVRAVKWSEVSEIARSGWLNWAAARSAGEFHDDAKRIFDAIDPSAGERFESTYPRTSALQLAERLLDDANRGRDIRASDLDAAAAACLAALDEIQANAAQGSFAMGGRPAASLTVDIATQLNVDTLLPALSKFLLNPTVAVGDKTPALNRLARAAEALPDSFIDQLRQGWDIVTRPVIGKFFEEDSIEFRGARLRFGVNAGIISEDAFIGDVTDLSCGESAERFEALRCIAYSALADKALSWAATLTIQLSLDGDPTVRSNAAFVLGRSYGRYGSMVSSAKRRLAALLESDGIYIPLLALRGLLEAEFFVTHGGDEQLISLVRRLLANHGATVVRDAARSVVALVEDGGG